MPTSWESCTKNTAWWVSTFRGEPRCCFSVLDGIDGQIKKKWWHSPAIETGRYDCCSSGMPKFQLPCGAIVYPTPIHLQPVYALPGATLDYKQGDLPETERACREVLSLPMYAELTQAQIERVAGAIGHAL